MVEPTHNTHNITLTDAHKSSFGGLWYYFHQVTLLGGQTGSPYWGTNRLALLGDKQAAPIEGQIGCPYWGQTGSPYWGTNM